MNELDWFEKNSANFHGELRFDESLAKHTYYRIGGPASLMAFPKDERALRWLNEGVEATGVDCFILGLGSNLLVSDEGFRGLVIKTSRLDLSIEVVSARADESSDEIILRTGASVAISTLLRRAAQEGWAGLECLAGVPGSVGGVLFMNAGTHLGEAQERIHRAGAYLMKSGRAMLWERREMEFDYRRNRFLPEGAVVTWVEWRLAREAPSVVAKSLSETFERRKATQPVEFPSCGSVFKNPHASGLRAWQVMDRLGLRGYRIGNAQFAEKHSNFIVNLGGASAMDVRRLIELAKSRASAELGIVLEEEVRFLGPFGVLGQSAV